MSCIDQKCDKCQCSKGKVDKLKLDLYQGVPIKPFKDIENKINEIVEVLNKLLESKGK